MAKSDKELQNLKNKVDNLNKELKELSDEELELVSGGIAGQPVAYPFSTKKRREQERKELGQFAD